MKNKIFIIGGVLAAFASFILALQLAPWLYAINVRVRLYMTAPAETPVNICWDEQQTECLPLVPFSTENGQIAREGEMADVWLSELPPRPSYFIALQLEKGFQNKEFQYLELDSANVFLQGYGKEIGAGVYNLQLTLDDFNNLNDAILVYDQKINSGSQNLSGNNGVLVVWLALFSIFLILLIPAYLLSDALGNVNLNLNVAQPEQTMISKFILFLCLIVGAVMVLLVRNSGVIINPYDPVGYLLLATNDIFFNVARLPGYPLFLNFVFSLFNNYSLDNVALTQAFILTSSVLVCVWVLRRWLSPFIVLPFVILSLFSPVQIHYARWIIRESLFSSLTILGLAALFAHFSSRKPISSIWLMIFALICGVAFLVRENGVILPLALAPILLLRGINYLFSEQKISSRLRSIFLMAIQYSPPFIAVGLVYIGFSLYNYSQYGFFQLLEQQTSHGSLSKAMSTSNFDARGLLEAHGVVSSEAQSYMGFKLYSAYIMGRDQYYGDDQTYTAFFPAINSQLIERGVPVGQFNIFYEASILNEVGRSVDNLMPWQVEFSGFLRQYLRIVFDQAQYPYSLTPFFSGEKLQFLEELPVKFTVEFDSAEVAPNIWVVSFYDYTQSYFWFKILFVGSLLAGVYVLKYEHPMFIMPLTVYLANCILVLYSHMVAARVFVHIDVMLVLQIALGLSLWLARRARKRQQHFVPTSVASM